MSKTAGYTDQIFQTYKLYIEGVQVPWEGMTITQSIGALPSATIAVPAVAGMMDISRFYKPKVHIFYQDLEAYRKATPEQRKKEKDFYRLLFQGVITGVSYTKSRSGGGNMSLQFSCAHKNSLLQNLYIDYSGWISNPIKPKEDGAFAAAAPNSRFAIQRALAGISTDYSPESSISKDNPGGSLRSLTSNLYKYYSKLQGMPGIIVNYWNQLKQDAYNKELTNEQDVFLKMYEPLVDKGLQFFERLSGHPSLEVLIDGGRVNPCPDKPGADPIIIPPCNKVMVMSASQTSITIGLLNNYLQSNGEITTIENLMKDVYASMDYEILTLASPAEAPLTPESIGVIKLYTKEDNLSTSAVETIVKPVIPFYFSPWCNVLFPKMYHTLNVQYDTGSIPTRVSLVNKEMQGNDDPLTNTYFRAPDSIRKAIADKSKDKNLTDTLSYSHGAIGKYEQGSGIIPEIYQMPSWLGYLNSSLAISEKGVKTQDNSINPTESDMLKDLEDSWNERYPDNAGMNPYSVSSDTSPHHRIMYSSADYNYAEKFARAKGGTVIGGFNPYIIPGYPMDILDASPTLPSFHALCMMVTHNISGTSVTTSINFTAAVTYSELANYYIPFMHPFLLGALGLARYPTLVNTSSDSDVYSDIAVDKADEFYYYTLGVKCAPPKLLYDFSKGTIKPLARDSNNSITDIGASTSPKIGTNGGDLNPNNSYEGNLSFVHRDIESQSKIEERFNLKFIDMSYDNYSPATVKYKDKILSQPDKLEIGASQFLTYDSNFGANI